MPGKALAAAASHYPGGTGHRGVQCLAQFEAEERVVSDRQRLGSTNAERSVASRERPLSVQGFPGRERRAGSGEGLGCFRVRRKMLRYRQGPQVQDAHAEGGWCIAAAEASEGLSLLSGGMDGGIKGWKYDGEELTEQFALEAHALGVVSLAVAAAGDAVASSSLDGYLKVWRWRDHELVEQYRADTNVAEAWGLSFSPDGRFVASGSHSFRVNVWACEDDLHREATLRSERNAMVMSVAYSADGRRLAAGSSDGSIQVFDVESGAVSVRLPGHAMPVRSVCFSPSDPDVLVSGGEDGFVNVYDVKNSQLVSNLAGHDADVLCVDANSDNLRIASGAVDRCVKVWDRRSRECEFTSKPHSDRVWGVSFLSEGTLLASISDDRSLAVLNCGQKEVSGG